MVWNVLGLIDLGVALATGGTYIARFAPQLVAAGISPLYLNYVLIIPTFGVPLFILLHVYSLIQIASPRTEMIARAGDVLSRASVVPISITDLLAISANFIYNLRDSS
jgi:membrane protein implicated in regulation of membrane protease activity